MSLQHHNVEFDLQLGYNPITGFMGEESSREEHDLDKEERFQMSRTDFDKAIFEDLNDKVQRLALFNSIREFTAEVKDMIRRATDMQIIANTTLNKIHNQMAQNQIIMQDL